MSMPDSRGPHPIDIVPPATLASPSDMPPFGDDVPFWTPDWHDVLKHMGWRWVLFLPALALIAILCAVPWQPGLLTILIFGGGKLAVIFVGGAIGVATGAIRGAVRMRKDPFCIHCGYELTGLPDGHQCPECGRTFSLTTIDEYRRDPHWFIKRHRSHQNFVTKVIPFDAGPIRRRKSRDGT